jgi:predicted ABC-type ATPase
MVIIAGPPGSGKSVAFPVSSFGIDYFNADDRAAQLNNTSYQGIPLEIRAAVNDEFERFVQEHIRQRKTFAIETTLRSDITFRQAQQARAEGFEIHMRYIALSDFSQNLKRVTARARAGGHSAPADQLRRIHAASIANLPLAIRETDELRVYDNIVLSARKAGINYLSAQSPQWLEDALLSTEYEITEQLRAAIAAKASDLEADRTMAFRGRSRPGCTDDVPIGVNRA